MHRWLSTSFRHYLYALIVAALATLASVGLQAVTSGRVVIMPYFPAVIIVALHAGVRAGALTAVVAVAATMIFWMSTIGAPMAYTANDWVVLGTFAMTSALMIVAAGRVRRADVRFRLRLCENIIAVVARK